MDEIGHLRLNGDRFEFHFPELGLVVRGPYAEWVLEAAGEVIAQTEKMKTEGHIEELKTLSEFGEVDSIEVDSAAFDSASRFEAIPQCIVSMGRFDYHWVSPAGRDRDVGAGGMRRIVDLSKTRNETFLTNEDGVEPTAN